MGFSFHSLSPDSKGCVDPMRFPKVNYNPFAIIILIINLSTHSKIISEICTGTSISFTFIVWLFIYLNLVKDISLLLLLGLFLLL